MTVETPMFGIMEIPNTKDEIKSELERCKRRYCYIPTRYLQSRIDCLEEEIDEFRSE